VATRSRTLRSVATAAAAGLGILAMTGCGLQIEPIDGLPEGATMTVASKNFTEQLILGKIGVIAARAAGFEVNDMTNIPGSVPVREVMLTGTADFTWEYTGTAWLSFLGEEEGIPDSTEQYEAVRDADEANGLTWLEPAPLNNTYAMAIRTEAVEELDGVATLSDMAALPVADRTICVEPEFNSRLDGLGPMLETYGIPRGESDGVPESNISIYDTGAVYTATDRGVCNFGEVFTTDGRIQSLDLTILEDDLGFFPAYNVAGVLSTEFVEEYPDIAAVFDLVSPALTDEKLRELNLRVDEGGEEPADVAYDFMRDEGFITDP
jgi:osmoprotectant transport system substrate-binding protein